MASVICFPPKWGGDMLQAKVPGCASLMYSSKCKQSALKGHYTPRAPPICGSTHMDNIRTKQNPKIQENIEKLIILTIHWHFMYVKPKKNIG